MSGERPAVGTGLITCAAFAGGYLLRYPVDALTGRVLRVRSEYTWVEQFTRTNILLLLGLALWSYRTAGERDRAATAAGFILLGIALHLGEGNFIPDVLEPLLGAPFGLAVALLFVRRRRTPALALLAAAGAVLAGGFLADVFSADGGGFGAVQSAVGRGGAAAFLVRSEETLDLCGVFLLLLSLLVSEPDLSRTLLHGSRGAVATYALGCILIAFGESFMHYQYHPVAGLRTVSLLVALAGFLVVLRAAARIRARAGAVPAVHVDGASVVFFALFVMLPATAGRARASTSALLWASAILLASFRLASAHPLLGRAVARGAGGTGGPGGAPGRNDPMP